MTDTTAGIACLERELETLSTNYAASEAEGVPFEDEQQQLRLASIAGLKAALGRLHQPVQHISPIDRDYQAIAILAYEALRASEEELIHPPMDEWSLAEASVRQRCISDTIAIARGETPRCCSVFRAVVRTALEMYDGNGGLAIEHLNDLACFLANEMEIEPTDEDITIVDVAKRVLGEQRETIEALTCKRDVEVPKIGDLYSNAPDDYGYIGEGHARFEALKLAISSSTRHLDKMNGDAIIEIVDRAKAFEQYLTGAPDRPAAAADAIMPEMVGRKVWLGDDAGLPAAACDAVTIEATTAGTSDCWTTVIATDGLSNSGSIAIEP